MTNKSMSPCLHCVKVREPGLCENKTCKLWRTWFVAQWEQTRLLYRRHMEQAQLCECGVPLGGLRYASPHQVREYLHNDPCGSCLYPKDLCAVPCPVRLHWEQIRNEVVS